ncbi:expressed unknown protein [Seminavis robusta]|uniref:Uncharacterized protein n=1 Tax=Seminavis robusta TaxID=568900 RepID=A0A9N8D4I2_9STRA|nr:expressed unknown protein [Seminavis robusta]|eukprot:Sro3_g002680.1 n/a (242) ;mRNA; f:216722-217447
MKKFAILYITWTALLLGVASESSSPKRRMRGGGDQVAEDLTPARHLLRNPTIYSNGFETASSLGEVSLSNNLFLGTTGSTDQIRLASSMTTYGQLGGGVRIRLFDDDNDSIYNHGKVSAGIEFTFDSPFDVNEAEIRFAYRVNFADGFQTADVGQVLLDVDGSVQVVEEYRGYTTYSGATWKAATLSIGSLAQGTSHTIKLGGYLHYAPSEVAQMPGEPEPTRPRNRFQIRIDTIEIVQAS